MAIGGCQGCHTASGGAPFAGGRAFETAFGTVYSTNITPDAVHGIGRWSGADFARAMTRGIGPDGERYYPVFPYEHYALADPADIAAVFAYVRTLPRSGAADRPDRLAPPFGWRPLLAIWEALAPHPRPLPVSAHAGPDVRRGAILVAGLGHCGACHTPRDALHGERPGHALAGAMAEGWYAPPLQGASPAPVAWTAQDLTVYLRTGLSDRHQAAAGPMGAVIHALATAPEAEVRDMAAYLEVSMGAARHPAPIDNADAAARAEPQGARTYAGACATCHEPGAGMRLEARPSLALGTPLDEDRPTDVIQIVLHGLSPPPGRGGAYMPPFADSLTDSQVAHLTAYLRARFSRAGPWRDLPQAVNSARKAVGG